MILKIIARECMRHGENQKLIRELNRMANAIENLTAAVSKLTSSVDAAVAKITAPPTVIGVAEADVQAAADAVNIQSARLDAASLVNPS
jgi:esterase/lipase